MSMQRYEHRGGLRWVRQAGRNIPGHAADVPPLCAGETMTRHRVGRLILLVVLIVGVDDACGLFRSTGPAVKGFQNVSGNWNYVTDTMVDSVAQLSCVVTTQMTLAQQTDGTITGTYVGMSVSCHSPSGPVILHRDGTVTGHTLTGCFFTCPPPAGTPPSSADIYFDTAFHNVATESDGTHLGGTVFSRNISINGKPFGGSGVWTATKR